jgi:hypothetical protein
MTSLRLALFALALGACATPAAVHAPAAPAATSPEDIYHLCDDARFEAMCSPVSTEQPLQVDTNLESPRVRSTLAS